MHTPNPQVVHARNCVDNAEDAIHRMEGTVSVRLLAGYSTTREELYLGVLNDKLGEFRIKLDELEVRYPGEVGG